MPENENNNEIKVIQLAIRVLDFPNTQKEIQFINDIKSLVGDPDRVNELFPLVFDYSYINSYDARSQRRLTSLPPELLYSDTYDLRPDLRGQMEEIILVTNEQRRLNGYSCWEVRGGGWSQYFSQRLEEINKIEPVIKPQIFTTKPQKQSERPKPKTIMSRPPKNNTNSDTVGSNEPNPKPTNNHANRLPHKTMNIHDLGSHKSYYIQPLGLTKGGARKINGKVMPHNPAKY